MTHDSFGILTMAHVLVHRSVEKLRQKWRNTFKTVIEGRTARGPSLTAEMVETVRRAQRRYDIHKI